jgi:predicted transcriptional regulator
MLLKEWRWLQGLTQEGLAMELSCSQSLLALVEGGKKDSKHIKRRFKENFPVDYKKIDEFK